MVPGVKRITLYLHLPYLLFPKLLKKIYIKKFLRMSKIYFQNFNMVSAKTSVRKMSVLLQKGENAGKKKTFRTLLTN